MWIVARNRSSAGDNRGPIISSVIGYFECKTKQVSIRIVRINQIGNCKCTILGTPLLVPQRVKGPLPRTHEQEIAVIIG